MTDSQDPRANVWQSQTDSGSPNNTAYAGSAGKQVARATVQDGKVVSAEVSPSVLSSANITPSQIVPYDFALDAKTRSRLSPDQVQDDSILSFNGAEITAAYARKIGWLPARDVDRAEGQVRYEQPSRPLEQGHEPPKEEVHPDLKVDLLADEALDRDYSNLVENAPGVEGREAIRQIIEIGAIDERTLGTLASNLRVEPSALSERVAPIMKAFETQARAVMSEGGLDSNAVVAWAQQHRPDKLQLAMTRQATLRQTSGYAGLRQDYLESLAEHSPNMALAADLGSGITQFKDDKGQIIVHMPDGSTMLWQTAFKAYGVRK